MNRFLKIEIQELHTFGSTRALAPSYDKCISDRLKLATKLRLSCSIFLSARLNLGLSPIRLCPAHHLDLVATRVWGLES